MIKKTINILVIIISMIAFSPIFISMKDTVGIFGAPPVLVWGILISVVLLVLLLLKILIDRGTS